ncbi:Patatin-like phospholipase domain-containing protein [Seminavis robusta]|uniref:Patatin-like phospholipase domain-containing protein n=1 Tax=Seminavis robusta TaxID=568900 RepID=A0A9N8DLM9_9STRA|nr:Patatin-like phospholipase domain-containing protein [Seminavis robusta]|eukprot:Sro228_g092540.1 Patatin-like phospholipase domain-containing protein (580) ;mRNA; r:11693-13576
MNLLRAAPSYEEWHKVAESLDGISDHGEQLKIQILDQFDLYYVDQLTRSFECGVQGNDFDAVIRHLIIGLNCRKDYALLEHSDMFVATHTGEPHQIVSNFVEKLAEGLEWVINEVKAGSCDDLQIAMAQQLFEKAEARYGQTAYCFSGGATMAFKNLGIALAMLDNVLSGSSGGSIFACALAVRTDDEIRDEIKVEVMCSRITSLSQTFLERMMILFSHGHVFDPLEWEKSILWFTKGHMTFAEAYEKSGRVFNACVTSTTEKARPILLNHITAPGVTVASAVLCSVCCPGLLPPRPLQVKRHDGTDGSVKQDTPKAALAEMFDCRFFVSGQTNPHVTPFCFESRVLGKWRGGFLLAATEKLLKVAMTLLSHLNLLPWQASSIVLQDYEGCVVPELTFADCYNFCAEPTVPFYSWMMLCGKVAAYPFCNRIRQRARIASLLTTGTEAMQVFDTEEIQEIADRGLDRPSARGSTILCRPEMAPLAEAEDEDDLCLGDSEDEGDNSEHPSLSGSSRCNCKKVLTRRQSVIMSTTPGPGFRRTATADDVMCWSRHSDLPVLKSSVPLMKVTADVHGHVAVDC